MVSNSQRIKYAFENVGSTSEEDSCEDTDYAPRNRNNLRKTNSDGSGSGRKPKCFSKNALMARENRLKKKMYISRLESDVTSLKNENKKLSKIVDNQSLLIAELKRETKYLKSVIANSTDISNLIRNIRQSTGMSVSSSLDNNLSLKNVYVPKPKLPIARKTAHPWEEMEQYPSYPTPDSNHFSSPDHGLSDDLQSDLLNNIPLEFPVDIPEDLLSNIPFEDEKLIDKPTIALEEHNYTTTKQYNNLDDDVGVCLHVSKHKVSLEFCSTCSENAIQSWLNN